MLPSQEAHLETGIPMEPGPKDFDILLVWGAAWAFGVFKASQVFLPKQSQSGKGTLWVSHGI